MQFGTFREPRWSITFQEAYDNTVHSLLRDWAFLGSTIVMAVVLGAWINAVLNTA